MLDFNAIGFQISIISPEIFCSTTMPHPVKKAIFPVAGLGTRFLPASKAIPKEILTLVDRPLIQYSMDEAKESGIEEFIFVTSRGKGSLEDYFDRSPTLENHLKTKGKSDLLKLIEHATMESGSIAYVRQHEPLGLGDAVRCAKNLIKDEPFAVILTDDIIVSSVPVLKQMMDAYSSTGGQMVALTEIPTEEISNYGVIEPRSRTGSTVQIKRMLEKPSKGMEPSNLAIIGRYILTPKIFEHIENQSLGSNDEIQLTDAIHQEVLLGNPVNGFIFEGQRHDCGSKLGFLRAVVALALNRDDIKDEFREYLRSII